MGLAQGTGLGGLQEAGVHRAVQDTHLDTQLKSREAGQVWPSGAVLGTSHHSRVIALSIIPTPALWPLLFLPC